ncbi:hypothetical protein P280DRAFT_538892 [Massarina eburnea CBS 473.64]|uniref:NACHT domain-containing protein n=1 Tax=Massarina eburnea CBS 473.64 TaxID=1395130 RepID=A0A6A6S8H8_9PLEO|nr:hypothetical protein P280DRAFT_538892 [Massarina eburnea CBS 473.64]
MIKLAEIEASNKEIDIQGESRLNLIRQDILRLVAQTKRSTEDLVENQGAELARLKTKLDTLQKEQMTSKQQCVQAGSGKSTLMKSIYENTRTMKNLHEWAGSKRLYVASFYFWNQGTEKQKSGLGLFQSLLYQILRSTPDIMTTVCKDYMAQDRLHYEAWEMRELQEMFRRISQQDQLDAKFCFFIDGLDEYDGEEKDMIELLTALSLSEHIKICVSSRPGRLYESFLPSQDRKFDIANFTKEDMKRHIDIHLQKSSNWRNLAASDSQSSYDCQQIISEISARAAGVWLWVSLVTNDVVKEADKNEDIDTLRRIVHEFPHDLYAYFERMIKKIPKLHREEMAQMFLIAVVESRPFPLYAFSILEKERKNKDYVTDTPIHAQQEAIELVDWEALKSRVQNRCSDLLIIHDWLDHRPNYQTHSVDFLHRTVRDFLLDYHRQLRMYLVKDFDPLVSMSRICLGLLKTFPDDMDLRDVPHPGILIITSEIMHYAYEVEKQSELEEETPLVHVLDELDRVNSHYARDPTGVHWTQSCHSFKRDGRFVSGEGTQCSFLGLAVQARLVKYVRAKIQADHRNMQKDGRPLLDYALRIQDMTSRFLPNHRERYDPSPDIDMVKSLLRNGADPNQAVHLNSGYSVWELFLISIYELHEFDGSRSRAQKERLNKAWYKACEAMIEAGARSDCLPNSDLGMDASAVFHRVFGENRGYILDQEMEWKIKGTQQSGNSCITM